MDRTFIEAEITGLPPGLPAGTHLRLGTAFGGYLLPMRTLAPSGVGPVPARSATFIATEQGDTVEGYALDGAKQATYTAVQPAAPFTPSTVGPVGVQVSGTRGVLYAHEVGNFAFLIDYWPAPAMVAGSYDEDDDYHAAEAEQLDERTFRVVFTGPVVTTGLPSYTLELADILCDASLYTLRAPGVDAPPTVLEVRPAASGERDKLDLVVSAPLVFEVPYELSGPALQVPILMPPPGRSISYLVSHLAPHSLERARQVAENRVRVHFGADTPAANRGHPLDALNDRLYTLELMSPPGGRAARVMWVEGAGPGAVDLVLDQQLTGPGAVYLVRGDAALFAGGVPTAELRTFGPPASASRRAARQGRNFDLANVPTGEAGPGEEMPLGTLTLDPDGDYRNDVGLESLKKRVLRRLSTPRGAFLHLADYGLRLPQKRRITAGVLRDLEAQAIRQVRLEPGVRDARVGLSTPAPGVVRLEVTIVADAGRVGVAVDLPVS